MEIPKIVWDTATQEGCNSVQYIGEYDGFKVFGMGSIDENGFPEPTGLAELILLKDGETEVVGGEEAMKLLSRFNQP